MEKVIFISISIIALAIILGASLSTFKQKGLDMTVKSAISKCCAEGDTKDRCDFNRNCIMDKDLYKYGTTINDLINNKLISEEEAKEICGCK